MATNPPNGTGHRNGAVKDRSQAYNPKTDSWVKRNSDSERFMNLKKDSTSFKGVRFIVFKYYNSGIYKDYSNTGVNIM